MENEDKEPEIRIAPIDDRWMNVLQITQEGEIIVMDEFRPFLKNASVVTALSAVAQVMRLEYDLAGARIRIELP